MNPDARARRDALRAAVADEHAGRYAQTVRSLRQMIRAGQPAAMIPRELVPAPMLEAALDELIDYDGHADGRFGNLCAASIAAAGAASIADADIVWVCLVAQCPARDPDAELARHGWPFAGTRGQAERALLEQTDPVARIERRVAFALEGPSADPLLAATIGP